MSWSTLEELVSRTCSGGEHNLTQSSDRDAWSVCLGTLYGVPGAGIFWLRSWQQYF
jgi:hypothetical protein